MEPTRSARLVAARLRKLMLAREALTRLERAASKAVLAREALNRLDLVASQALDVAREARATAEAADQR